MSPHGAWCSVASFDSKTSHTRMYLLSLFIPRHFENDKLIRPRADQEKINPKDPAGWMDFLFRSERFLGPIIHNKHMTITYQSSDYTGHPNHSLNDHPSVSTSSPTRLVMTLKNPLSELSKSLSLRPNDRVDIWLQKNRHRLA